MQPKNQEAVVAVVLDGLDTERGGDVGFPRSRRCSDILLSIRGVW